MSKKLIRPSSDEDAEINEQIASDPDDVEVTEELIVSGDFTRTRGPQKAPTKIRVTMRLSPDVLQHFKAQGSGWQTRIDEALREHINR